MFEGHRIGPYAAPRKSDFYDLQTDGETGRKCGRIRWGQQISRPDTRKGATPCAAPSLYL